ncbi:MAG: sterol desaturase family protein [Candidatus Kapabacteria bacterium]|jgi:sterol desaturase/sphingolipid hydroxylase (fatty acid hydroxylase superfamily)|nr:sterol desaturase family protein [Candidatus Kapabacteria bacterium]
MTLPTDNYALMGIIVLTLLVARYTAISGTLFVWWYALKRGNSSRKIQMKYPTTKDYRREAGYSLLTMLVYATFIALVYIPQVRPYTRMYDSISDMGGPVWGWLYWVLSIVLMLLLHDLYFYWMHRAVHHKKIYPFVHKVHHLSHNPTPLAAFAFHPLEAFTEFLILPIVAFIIPHTTSAIAVWMFFMSLSNAYGHLGFEFYPKGFNNHPIGRWINTSVSHNMHHQFAQQNYGLYTLIWDRLFGTVHSKYDETYNEVTSRYHSEGTNAVTPVSTAISTPPLFHQ